MTSMRATADLLSLLRERGAEGLEHPGGTLLAHLVRVSHRLGQLHQGRDLRGVGLAHAFYGTAGFPLALQDRTDRTVLRNLLGDQDEELVHLYAGCDRGRSWRPLAETGQVWSRWDGTTSTLTGEDLRAFADLCAVNELDVMARSTTVPPAHRDAYATLFASWRPILSPGVSAAADELLSRSAS
jgi:hypothetical protein